MRGKAAVILKINQWFWKVMTDRRKKQEKIKFEPKSETSEEIQFFPPVLRPLFIVVLFIAAFGIRVYHIDDPPLDFHPGRQYQCAIIARSLYFEASKSVPQWRRQIARLNREGVPRMELPIVEFIASIAYRIAGGEHLWIPRLTSSIFWLVGGVVLYLLIKEIFSADTAIFSTAFYLFLPYGVIASRSFQPNPMMIMLLIFSIWRIFCYHKQPSTRSLFIAAGFSALALFVYPVSLFAIFATFTFLSIYKCGIRRTIIDSKFWLFTVIAVLPCAMYFGYAIFIGGFMKSYSEGAFLPRLLLQSFFWKGWLYQIEKVFGLPVLMGALLGVFMFPKGLARAMVLGLLLSYVVYSLIFTYHIHTHDYYQLPFVPTVTLSLSAVADLIIRRLSQTCARWYWRVPALVVIVFGVFLSIYKVQPELFNPNFKPHVEMLKEIGDAVGHSSKTIFLDYAYGKPLRYHGELSGYNWPNAGDFRSYVLSGIPVLSAEERFKTECLKNSPEYFIVTDFRSLQQQPDLQKFLVQNFPLLVKNPNYLIFDLRKKLKADG
jgi:hypothetical protein